MAFTFIPAGNNVKNSPIVWKFENHETVYQSEQVRFERNVEFWRNKNGFGSTERVVTLNGEFQPLEYTEFEDIEVKEPEYIEFAELEETVLEEESLLEELTELKEEAHESIIDESNDIASDSKSDVQPSVSQDTEAPINTPKRKPRKKTS